MANQTIYRPRNGQTPTTLFNRILSTLPVQYARINGELLPVYELVDVDSADQRAYVKTFAGSMTFCVPLEDVVTL